jgi:hypothetical protein
MHSALLQPELPGVVIFFIGFFMILIVAGGSVLFTYWISKEVVNPREGGVRPVQAVATPKEALPT